MQYRKGDVILVRMVVDHDYDGTETTLMVTPASDTYNSRSIKRADITGVERLKFDLNEPALYKNEPCTVKFVDERTNKAWISLPNFSVEDIVVPVTMLERRPVAVVSAAPV